MTLDEAVQLAVRHHQAGRLAEAEQIYRQVLAQAPEQAEAYSNLGQLLGQTGRLEEAIAACRRAVDLRPDLAGPHSNLGNFLKEKGLRDEAAAAYLRAIAVGPDWPMGYYNLGTLLQESGQPAAAEPYLRKALQLSPGDGPSLNNLANSLADQEKLEEAIDCHRQLIALAPNDAMSHHNLAVTLAPSGYVDEAIQSHRRAIELNPSQAAFHSAILLPMHSSGKYSDRMIFEEHLHWSRRHADPLAGWIEPHANDRSPDRRLRVGLVSRDFRLHPVGTFLLPALEHFDRRQFQIVCYSDAQPEDEMTSRIRAQTDLWRPVMALGDEPLARLIREDRIDILIDLAGHTALNRLLVFARKPAPVQITWLGYPDTTGLNTIDYRLTDAFADPLGQAEAYHTEKLWRLPHTFLCFQPDAEAPPVAELPAKSAGTITFGSFNNLSKVAPETMDLWARILHAAKDSRLMLKAAGLADESIRRRIREEFRQRGIAQDRLLLYGRLSRTVDHLAEYARVDVALDTFPYNGTTTTCEALWMGTPVVSLAGTRHAGRVGASLLSNVGLPELVARTPEEYVTIATELAGDSSRLSKLRGELRQQMKNSPLMDAAGFTRNLEAAYRSMWVDYCGG